MVQKNVTIGDVIVPIIEDDEEEWFPVSYLSEKVLLRKGNIIFKNDYIKVFIIDYDFCNGGIQGVKCVSKEGIVEYSKTVRKGRMDVSQSKAFNQLMDFLDINIIVSENKQFIYNPNSEIRTKLNLYESDSYNDIKEELNNDCWQLCSKCEIYYPFHKNFFSVNSSSPNGLNTFCRKCGWTESRSKDHINRKDKYLTRIYVKYGLDVYVFYRNHDVIKIYLHYLNSGIKTFPEIIHSKEDYMIILNHLYKKGCINKENLTMSLLKEQHKLIKFNKSISLTEIYQELFGQYFYIKNWEYPHFVFKDIKLTYDIANRIVDEYIKVHNIEIEDIFTFDYAALTKKCGISNFTFKDIQYFVVQYYKFQHPGYRFKITSNNYYKNDKNVLFDLQYLIEEDMKLQIEKIPLYLTRFNLQKKCIPLYRWIITKKNKSIYEWVNMIYPDKFIEADFDINPYRNEFDSDTEMYIHEILEQEFPKQVIYNQRNNGEVRLGGKIPDWFIFTDHGVWVVEYFGMLDENHCENSRIEHYKGRHNDKLNVYKELNGYEFLYLYINDTKNDFEGIRNKIKLIK